MLTVGAHVPHRALSAFKSDSDNLIEIMKILAVSTGPVYKALAQSEPITCAVKGTVFEAAPPPTVVIADVRFPDLQSHTMSDDDRLPS